MSKTTKKFAPEVREQAVRMALDPSIPLGSDHIDSGHDWLLGTRAAGVMRVLER